MIERLPLEKVADGYAPMMSGQAQFRVGPQGRRPPQSSPRRTAAAFFRILLAAWCPSYLDLRFLVMVLRRQRAEAGAFRVVERQSVAAPRGLFQAQPRSTSMGHLDGRGIPPSHAWTPPLGDAGLDIGEACGTSGASRPSPRLPFSSPRSGVNRCHRGHPVATRATASPRGAKAMDRTPTGAMAGLVYCARGDPTQGRRRETRTPGGAFSHPRTARLPQQPARRRPAWIDGAFSDSWQVRARLWRRLLGAPEAVASACGRLCLGGRAPGTGRLPAEAVHVDYAPRRSSRPCSSRPSRGLARPSPDTIGQPQTYANGPTALAYAGCITIPPARSRWLRSWVRQLDCSCSSPMTYPMSVAAASSGRSYAHRAIPPLIAPSRGCCARRQRFTHGTKVHRP